MEEREIPRLEMWGTVQKSVENDRSHLGMCCIECHVRCKLRLRADVTYMSLFWPWVSKKMLLGGNPCLLGKEDICQVFPGYCHLILGPWTCNHFSPATQ